LIEGHTGVALFMTLSGYLFAKLLDGKDINYVSFIWNRALRLLPLLPLLLFVIAIVGIRDYFYKDLNTVDNLERIAKGLILPTLPNGGWSITVEFHFFFFFLSCFFVQIDPGTHLFCLSGQRSSYDISCSCIWSRHSFHFCLTVRSLAV
jgi:peptidoglycan/LPS O-acetylase OafA/YrhL